MVRAMMINSALCIFVPSALWIASIHVEEPRRLALIWTAIGIGKYSLYLAPFRSKDNTRLVFQLDLFGYIVAIFLTRWSHLISVKFKEMMEKVFEFYPGRLYILESLPYRSFKEDIILSPFSARLRNCISFCQYFYRSETPFAFEGSKPSSQWVFK
jgi:hypothetical protein